MPFDFQIPSTLAPAETLKRLRRVSGLLHFAITPTRLYFSHSSAAAPGVVYQHVKAALGQGI